MYATVSAELDKIQSVFSHVFHLAVGVQEAMDGRESPEEYTEL